ncbi:hypothetical protein AMTRI_Chr08g201810 [Amborella trichopoda]|uniref:Glycosyl transferase CAP10 domain-containing protein n=1 Tax=Amborella trichopoda TaxID=13333 RepID=W1PQ25_AMBTC|nr:O-glucosyltransferase rumi homolog [Amborella trichopoda]ERN09811.1 hypothetical protein AMTR_s00029p00246540 [Amborella trichopoda]|eukprot:XP_020524900.1 O-glucosyltransferase rumi homolog [Amborella trichopoda]
MGRRRRSGYCGGCLHHHHLASHIPCTTTFLSLLSVAALLLLYKVAIISQTTKTIVGHNLEPTPWHRHQLPPDNNQWTAKYSKIFRCSYLLNACSSSSSSSTKPYKQPSIAYANPNLSSSRGECPAFFRWIHDDLSPWRDSGVRITQQKVMEARKWAAFRVVIVGGKLYVDLYYACVQSRAMFTIWGLLRLLDRFPGLVPDVDLMFDCMDRPMIHRSSFNNQSATSNSWNWPPPPLFRYCSSTKHFDIPFPDWSFWGWSEVNLAPWDEEFRSIKRGSQNLKWTEREARAYWKGNPDVQSPVREDLLRCNDSAIWGAQIMRQDWVEEARAGYEKSKLANQCTHRYKIYAEGYAWSVSLKYILSCGSLALIISPQYYDFFSRGLIPRKSFWPISSTNLCPSIKFAVDWGNEHQIEAEAIGRGGQDFMQAMNMETVYDYMFHLLMEYSKLQDFKPKAPPSAQLLCTESVLCFAGARERDFLLRETPAADSSHSLPCSLPSPDKKLIGAWTMHNQHIINEIQGKEVERNVST